MEEEALTVINLIVSLISYTLYGQGYLTIPVSMTSRAIFYLCCLLPFCHPLNKDVPPDTVC